MHALQSRDPDSLEHNHEEGGEGKLEEQCSCQSCWGPTHHGRAGAEVQKLGDEGINMKTHDLGCFQQERLKAAERGELDHTVRAGQGLQQQGEKLRSNGKGTDEDTVLADSLSPEPQLWENSFVACCEAPTAGLTVGSSGNSTGLGSLLRTWDRPFR